MIPSVHIPVPAQCLIQYGKVNRNVPKFSDRQIWANSADPDQTAPLLEEQSDQGLHCLQFPLHLLDALLEGKAILFNF